MAPGRVGEVQGGQRRAALARQPRPEGRVGLDEAQHAAGHRLAVDRGGDDERAADVAVVGGAGDDVRHRDPGGLGEPEVGGLDLDVDDLQRGGGQDRRDETLVVAGAARSEQQVESTRAGGGGALVGDLGRGLPQLGQEPLEPRDGRPERVAHDPSSSEKSKSS
jgi:hypothetical protein